MTSAGDHDAGTSGTSDSGAPDRAVDHNRDLAAAVGWMADRLAEALQNAPDAAELRRSADDDDDEEGGREDGLRDDAATFAPDYWHWKLQWQTRQSERKAKGAVTALPTNGPLLTVVVPVFRPSPWYFRECVQSVIKQSYQDWELCLCDDASNDLQLTRTMHEFADVDARIKVLALEENGGISRATNRALAEATGEFVVLLDHDDLLEPDALAEIAAVLAGQDDVDVVYTDEDKLDDVDRPYQPQFKPDWDPDLLLTYPYLGHVTAIRHDVLRRIGGFRPEFDGSQDFDVMLRATEVSRRVVHIPKVLYHWRVVAGSAAGDPTAKPWAYQASRRVLEDAVVRRGIAGTVESGPFIGGYHLRRDILDAPTVSVIIPFRDQARLTVACLDSLDMAPGYPIANVVLVDNGSTEPETRELRRQLEDRPATRVLDYPGPFNWSAINNMAAGTCSSDLLLFMNNDIEAISDGWLHALVEHAQRPEIGAVGARLLYPDGSIQHAGVILGMQGITGHIFSELPAGSQGYFHWDRTVRTFSAVTGACMMVQRSVFFELGGFDEKLPVAFNDVDFCIRLGQLGYRVLYTPHAELTHHESVSRGLSGYSADFQHFLGRWGQLIRRDDPYYSRNLSRFDPWCRFRGPDEDKRWLEQIDRLSPPEPVPRADPDRERVGSGADG